MGKIQELVEVIMAMSAIDETEEYPVLAAILRTIKNYENLTTIKPKRVCITTVRFKQLEEEVKRLPPRLQEMDMNMPHSILGVTIKIDDRAAKV